MLKQTALASASGLVAGIAITLVATGGMPANPTAELILPILARLAPLVCALLIAGKIFRRWLKTYTADARQDLLAIAQQRALFQEEVSERLDQFHAREEAMRRATRATDAQMLLMQGQLGEQGKRLSRLQADYDELAGDYNRVVADSLQQAATLFHPRVTATSEGPGVAIPMTTRIRPTRVGDATHERVRDAADPVGT